MFTLLLSEQLKQVKKPIYLFCNCSLKYPVSTKPLVRHVIFGFGRTFSPHFGPYCPALSCHLPCVDVIFDGFSGSPGPIVRYKVPACIPFEYIFC